MELLLVVATLLGGISALWFFWDKIVAWATGGQNVSAHDIALYEKYKSLFITDSRNFIGNMTSLELLARITGGRYRAMLMAGIQLRTSSLIRD